MKAKGLRRRNRRRPLFWGVGPCARDSRKWMPVSATVTRHFESATICVRTSWTTTSAASSSTDLPPACRPTGRTRTWRGSSSIRSWRRLPDIAVRTRRRARLTGALTLLVVSASWQSMRPIRLGSSGNNPYKDHISLRTIRFHPADLAQHFNPYTARSRAIRSAARLSGACPRCRNR